MRAIERVRDGFALIRSFTPQQILDMVMAKSPIPSKLLTAVHDVHGTREGWDTLARHVSSHPGIQRIAVHELSAALRLQREPQG